MVGQDPKTRGTRTLDDKSGEVLVEDTRSLIKMNLTSTTIQTSTLSNRLYNGTDVRLISRMVS